MSKLRYTYNLFRILKRKLSSKPDSVFTLQKVLEKNYPPDSPFNFILAGANDGVSHDFLYNFLKERKSKGIAIEPVPEYYQQLVKNYSSLQEVIPVNKAIHPNQKNVVIYKVDPAKLTHHPSWAAGIASLLPAHHKKSGINSNDIIEEHVNADNFMNILAEHIPYFKVDFIQIDTEGFDYEILKQIDFNMVNPPVIRFEYFNLSDNDTDAAIHLLKQHGYYCFYDDINIAAVKLNQISL